MNLINKFFYGQLGAAPESTTAGYLPYLGVAAGMVTGVVSKPLASLKDRLLCRTAFQNFPALKAINGFKQWEIKNCALLTPLLPLAAQLTCDTVKSDGAGVIARLKDAVQKVTPHQKASLILVLTLGLTNSLYARAIGLSTENFDSSGHIMLKTLLAHLLACNLDSIGQRGGTVLKTITAFYGSLYAFTDAVLIHNSANFCHTAYEAVAGLEWGAGILSLFRHRVGALFA